MYKSIDDLPQHLKDELPREARELYRAAYNRILEKESTPGEAEPPDRAHRLAHEGGMLAVMGEFQQDESGRWHRDPVGEHTDRADEAG